jgi:voltage-gated potassium channel
MKMQRNTRITIILIIIALFSTSILLNMCSGLSPQYSLVETTFGSFKLNYFILESPMYLVSRYNPLLFASNVVNLLVFLLITVLIASWFFDFISSISIREKLIEGRIKRTKNHVIIAPFNDLAKSLLEELKQSKINAVFITEDAHDLAALQASGVMMISGAIKSAEVFEAAGIRRAAYVVACSESDIQNALISVTAKNANPDVKIISLVHEDANIPKLSMAGAYRMTKPEISAGEMVADELLKRLV